MHVGEVESLLAVVLVGSGVLLAEQAAEKLLLAPFDILLVSHRQRCLNVSARHLAAESVIACGVVVIDDRLDVLRQVKVGGVAAEVGSVNRHCALHFPKRMEQRIGNLVVLGKDWLFEYAPVRIVR